MEDYCDAAQRHFCDAQTLHDQVPSRLANASHLYGISAECAVKTILCGPKKIGKVPRGSSGHFPKLLEEFENHSVSRGNSALVKRLKQCSSGLEAWNINQRYEHQSLFIAQTVQQEAESTRKLIALSQHYLRGVI